VATVVHAAGRNEGLAAGLALELSDGALDGDALDPLGRMLGLALDAGRLGLSEGLAEGAAQAPSSRATVASPAIADRPPIAGLGKRDMNTRDMNTPDLVPRTGLWGYGAREVRYAPMVLQATSTSLHWLCR
jgi:hypothetical protein